MLDVVLGITFVALAFAVMIWRAFERAREIAGAPGRARVIPESPALAISHGVGDLRGSGLRDDGSTAEHGCRKGVRGADGERF